MWCDSTLRYHFEEDVMKVHPKQLKEAIQHIYKAWPTGCQCKVCKTVDKQENITK